MKWEKKAKKLIEASELELKNGNGRAYASLSMDFATLLKGEAYDGL